MGNSRRPRLKKSELGNLFCHLHDELSGRTKNDDLRSAQGDIYELDGGDAKCGRLARNRFCDWPDNVGTFHEDGDGGGLMMGEASSKPMRSTAFLKFRARARVPRIASSAPGTIARSRRGC